MNSTQKKHGGFTLMEMLIALVIAAIIISPLYIITRTMSEQTGFQQMEVEAMQRARAGMSLLVRDFSRAGLFTSPNTAMDPRSINDKVTGDLQYRAAVVHLNRQIGGNDAVLITGNLLGSEIYTADYFGGDTFTLINLESQPLCEEVLFNPAYAAAQILNHRDEILEAEVTGATLNLENQCDVTVTPSPTVNNFVAQGDTGLRVSANQTALFRVESGQLVRYFVKYDGPGTANSECDLASTFLAADNLTGRRVLADKVQSFQVWFRTKRLVEVNDPVSGEEEQWNVPSYPPLASYTLSSGLVPSGSAYVLSQDGATVPLSDQDVSCNLTADVIRPEQVRSAVIKLSVRVPVADYNAYVPADVADAGDPEGRLIRSNLAAKADGKAAYRLKTLTTEIEMPNLAARSDL
jgi:prepilin-type N-terminal cleavage/methylation domain-containing protein